LLLSTVTILYHPRRPRALEEATWLRDELARQHIDVTIGNGWDEDLLEVVCSARDLVVALGGDGTIIRVARAAAPFGVPVLGVNLGRVGFLAELTPDTLHQQVKAITSGKFWIERRIMLDVECRTKDSVYRSLALNEVAVARGAAPRAILVRTVLDEDAFMTFTADGVLVATATGSTAYSMAAGGPILYPESQDFMLTPVAPHLHIGRSIVVPGDTTVTLCLATDRAAVLSVDGGEEMALQPEDTVTVRKSALQASFARLGPRTYFYTALADRLK
jgi:NAD+ kinase